MRMGNEKVGWHLVLPMTPLKYVLMAACILASCSGSVDGENCVSCASMVAGCNDDTSSTVHSNSNCVEHICGVAGRWNNDGLSHKRNQIKSIQCLHEIIASHWIFYAHLSINGRCMRSAFASSNGLTTFRKRDGGVGVFTMGNA